MKKAVFRCAHKNPIIIGDSMPAPRILFTAFRHNYNLDRMTIRFYLLQQNTVGLIIR